MAVSAGPSVVEDGLVLCLDAANKLSYAGAGNTWIDLAGSNNGTLTNGPVFDDERGGSIVLDGTDDYINFNDLPLSTVYSVSCWFSTDIGDWNGALFGFGTGNSPNTQDVYLFGEATIGCSSPSGGSFGFNTWNCDSWAFANASSVLKGTGFHHVVAIFYHQDVSSNGLWIDGVKKSLSQQTGTTNFNANLKNRFKIAANGWRVVDQLWRGSIASCSVYNRALSEQEIKQNYKALRGRFN